MSDQIQQKTAEALSPTEPDKLEAMLSHEEVSKDRTNYDRVDEELAKYAADLPVHIDEETNKRLKKSIDKRVLVIMIVTYFLQSVDKGALGFASIMGLQEDTGLHGTQVSS